MRTISAPPSGKKVERGRSMTPVRSSVSSSRPLPVHAVRDRVAQAARDEEAVHWVGGDEGQNEREREARPEEHIEEPGVHRARDGDDDRVVDELDDGDGDRLRGERYGGG